MIEAIKKIEDAFRELSLTDPAYLNQRVDQDKQAISIVESCVRDMESSVANRLRAEYFGFGAITSLIDRDDVTEIIINGRNSIWFEANGRLHRHDDEFLTEQTFNNFVQRICREAKVQATLDRPFADGHWGRFRLHIAVPPATSTSAVTLRKHPSNPWRLDDLAHREWATATALHQLRDLISQKKNILIVGCTGSGKTSVLNACLQELQNDERAILIEDTNELEVPNPLSTKLLTRRDSHGLLREVDQSELLKQTLRMRPDRIIMGEIRGVEAKDLLMAFATGHSGCMGTMHAENARQALLRLEMLIQLGAAQWNVHAVRTLILLSLHAIVVVKKTNEGERKLEGIYRIASLEDVGFLLEKTT